MLLIVQQSSRQGTILGVSLGASRVMRLETAAGEDETEGEFIDVLLESGSVYVQT